MLNNKNDLSMIPTINNDGNSYIIPMDMYKEGYWAYNISNYFKARVDDNGTPFMIRWYKHGQLANVLNLRPFIRGRVGGYTIDDSNATADPKIVMDENASSVDWTGETTDTQAGGIAIYRTINQCYPQDGIFYGQVGLRSSDGDTVVTGIDIIFKVLDGNVNMLGARKYYVSELTKAMLEFQSKMDQHDRDYQAKLTQQEQEYQAKMDQNDKDFKSKTDQLIADARAAYTKETQNTHDALTAAQAQIQANRDEQANLSNRLAGTEQQIMIHNVATLDQFTALSKQALERLASIGAQPQYYDTVEAMKAANPSGTNNLCETVNDGHRWLYINGTWQDCGAVKDNAFRAARDASQDILYGQDILEWDKSTKGIVVPATEDFASFEDKPIMHLHSTSTDDYVYLISDTVTVSKQIISVQFPEMIKNLIGIKDAAMEIRQLSPADDPADPSTFADNSIWLNFSDPQMTLYKAPNLKLKEKTDRIQIVYQIHGIGDVYVGKPVINYGSKCISYSPFQSIQDAQIVENKLTSDILHISQNLLSNQDIRNWTQNTQNKVQVTSETSVQFHATPIMHMIGTEDDQWNHLFSNEIPVTQHNISLQLPEMVANQIYGKSKGYISIVPLSDGEKYGDKSTFGKLINLTLSNTMMKLHRYSNITLPENTSRIVIDIIQYGKGDLYFGDPVINYGSTFVPYDQLEISEKFDNVLQRSKENSSNLLYGMDVTSFNNSVKGKTSIATEADKQFNGTTIMHITGTENDQWNHSISKEIPVTQHTISLQLPEMVANQIYGKSKGYISIVPLSDGEKYGDKSTYGKLINLIMSNLTMKLQRYPNITLPENTSRIVIDIIQYGIGDLYFGVPVINYGPQCITYDQITLSQDLTNLANKVGNSGDVFPIPEMHISADSGSYGYSQDPVEFSLLKSGKAITGCLNFDIQGDSSRGYPKTNFKIKLYTDKTKKNELKVKMKSSWPTTNKYNLKANWIDATQARNIVNARLVKDAVAVTPLENPAQTSKILSTEGLGQVDGFPIELYFNDDYYGLYTLNTKKDETTFGMDSKDVTNEVLSTELGKKDLTDSTKAIIDGTNWSTEIHDTATENIKGNLVKFLNFVEQSNDMDFHANLKNYIDVSSVINLILFGWLSQEYDFYSKSELFATWNDGGYWYLIPYDLDSTWGLLWDGSDVLPNRDDFDLSKIFSDPQTAWAASANDNKLQQRVINLFKPEIKKQGQLLRSTVWSTPNIIAKFKDFIDEVPTFSYQRDQEKWTTIPSIKTTDFRQIQSAIILRGQEFDNFISKI